MKYISIYKVKPGNGQAGVIEEIPFEAYKKHPEMYTIVNGIPFDKKEEVPEEVALTKAECIAILETAEVEFDKGVKVAELRDLVNSLKDEKSN